ncbi:9709_t:CDS:1, partial [Ambispora leptoticha]
KELQEFKDEKGNVQPRVKLCFDTQHYFAAGAGRFIEDYKQVLDKYGKEIHLIHINNVMKERKLTRNDGSILVMKPTIFRSGQDIHAPLHDGQLPQEIFEMIMKHSNVKAAILETPAKMEQQKDDQISEVYTLRKYAKDLISEDKELYASIEERIDAMLRDQISNKQPVDIEMIDLTEHMQRLTIQDHEHYQDPKEEESQKRIREQKRAKTLHITNTFLNKYRKEETQKKKKQSPPTTPKSITSMLNKNAKDITQLNQKAKENKDTQFIQDLEDLMKEITDIENQYESIQRMPRETLEKAYENIKGIPTVPEQIKQINDNETPREKLY